MDCPKCQFVNREGAKFCKECGNKLELLCPSCGHGYEPGSKFCDECGHNLTAPQESKLPPKDLSPDDKIAKIQRYLPQGLAEKVFAQRDKIEGERKQVTVMFCDLEGFTPLSERLGPEDAYALMDQVYEILIHKVHDYEGTVNEMTGDGIMALFGAPVALEDAPQRAIRAALAIHREMVRFSDTMKLERPGLPTLKMRIGIHTGPVVVGTLGNDLRVEFKAVGDTVNLASRMEGLAEPGTTYVSGETFKLTEGLFRFEGLGVKEVKGKAEPVPVYRVVAPSTRRTRFDVSAERGLTPFVGRERELELVLDAFARAKEGRGQAVSITGGPGDGKSRILYEFRKKVANEDVTFLEGKCLSYSRGVAYHPVIDILKGNFDIREGDGDEEIRGKVQRQLGALGVDEGSTLPYLLELLSVKHSGIDQVSLSPEGKKDRTLQALDRIVLKGAETRPLILVVEDLHWMDKSSEDAFRDLVEHIAGAGVLLLFTYRTEYVHTWGSRSYHSQITLNRFADRETLAMVTHLLGTEHIAENLLSLILEKTEGVAFFIEEFVKSLRDLRIIERRGDTWVLTRDPRDVTIPSTIQDVIMARVDTLPGGGKEVLQAASVIEREFPHELLQKVAGLREPELLTYLSALQDAELLYKRGVYPQSTYIFKHALTREVVYESILGKKRKQLHEATGTAMEALYPDTVGEHYEMLCEHFVASEAYAKGAKYARLTGTKAEENGLFVDAVSYCEKGISCLEKLPITAETQREIIDARTTLGLYLLQTENFAQAKEIIDPILELTVKSGDKKGISQAHIIMGVYRATIEGNISEALVYLAEALSLAEEIHHIPSLYFAHFWLGVTLGFDCQWGKSANHFDKVLEINIASNRLWGIVATRSARCMVERDVNLAYQTSRGAVKLAEESRDIYSKAMAHTYHGWSSFFKGSLEESVEHLLNGADFSRKIGSLSSVHDRK